jgi:hypothetical protein
MQDATYNWIVRDDDALRSLMAVVGQGGRGQEESEQDAA